jgi:hypothetical protein
MAVTNLYRRYPIVIAILWVVVALHLAACDVDDPPQARAQDSPEALSTTSEEGPVAATVTLSPKSPRLGDVLTLTLTVLSEPNVSVDMPAFGEALGRFSIIDFAPRQTVHEDGSGEASQRYRLQPPMSGRQRIPGLRIEYVDDRSGAGAGDYQELITDEISIQVESVLPEGDLISELRPARGLLAEQTGNWLDQWPLILAAIVIGAGAVIGIVSWQRHSVVRARLSAFDRALARMQRLEAEGLPTDEGADAWYVELSDIVRRYIEDRYAVRAPELTTEEFLLAARHSVDFTATHRDLLTAFLERCDRVKFAAYHPSADESREALDVARRFLSETRVAGTAGQVDSVMREAA